MIGVFALPALAQDKCKTDLQEAQKKYDEGQLDEAIALLNGCLRRGNLTTVESEKIYTLLAKANHAKELLDRARENLKQLLTLVPSWRPNPEVDPPAFQKFAETVIKEVKPTEKSGGKKWLFIGGGAAAAGALAFIVFKGEETVAGPKLLPGPPNIPPRQ
jgi:hypothetical protein